MWKMSEHTYRSVYEVLDSLRRRPGVFLPHASLDTLLAFLGGLSFSSLEPGDPPFWDFSLWITGFVDGIALTMPWAWLIERHGNERALTLYFEYLEEYRRCHVVALERSTGPFAPQFTVSASFDQTPRPPVAPEVIIIGQFAPSNVFFVGTIQSGVMEKHFPFQRTAEAAREHAERAWAVPKQSWTAQPE
jgi:hypothetical protein